ncbi:hypothetical protein EUX98_g6914 [Antrodiella citrinella]|uniref:Clp1-like protein n=1 Tax=Antrodiella citrinella TaxID=2447956 RepID=A0A4S4MN07_9APHY|nr:hypothetical protein EUX98_g6914 [Antrodiella citrinella]
MVAKPVNRHRVLMRKSSNVENMAPYARKISLNSGRKISQQLSHHFTSRIRARTAGLPRTKVLKDEHLPTPPATPAPAFQSAPPAVAAPDVNVAATDPLADLADSILKNHPKLLVPPPVENFGVVRSDSLAWIDPALESLPVSFLQDSLKGKSAAMLRVCAGIRAPNLPQHLIPPFLDVQAWNLETEMPSHMLAIYPLPGTPNPAVTLYPIHDVIFASHCARWPKCPQTTVEAPSTPGGDIHLPVVRIPIPAPAAFPLLASYLYKKQPNLVLKNALPAMDDAFLATLTPAQWLAPQFGRMVAGKFSLEVLVGRARFILGFRANLLALGVADERVWHDLQRAWSVIRVALEVKLGQA